MATQDDDFLNYFEEELSNLSEHFKEFGARYPKAVTTAKIAPKSSDPHINLLLESFAYYSAKIRSSVEEIKYATPELLLSNIEPALIEQVPAMVLAPAGSRYQ